MHADPSEPGIPTIAHIHVDENAGSAFVRLSDGEQFELAPQAPELDRLEVGAPATPALRAGLEAAVTRKALAREAFLHLRRRALSRARLRDKLAEHCREPELLDAVLDQFESQGLLDDRRFATMFVEDQLRARAIGPLSLLQRMAQQGIPRDVAEAAVRESIDVDRETELARRALRRRPRASDANQHAKNQRFLRSRGFSSRAIASALRAEEADAAD